MQDVARVCAATHTTVSAQLRDRTIQLSCCQSHVKAEAFGSRLGHCPVAILPKAREEQAGFCFFLRVSAQALNRLCVSAHSRWEADMTLARGMKVVRCHLIIRTSGAMGSRRVPCKLGTNKKKPWVRRPCDVRVKAQIVSGRSGLER